MHWLSLISYRAAAADARLAAPRLGVMAGGPRKRKKGTRPSMRSYAPFLAYLYAGFLFLGLDAIELRIGSAK